MRIDRRAGLSALIVAGTAAVAAVPWATGAHGQAITVRGGPAARDLQRRPGPPPVSGKRIVDANGVPGGTVTVHYTGSSAECEFLHHAHPAVPAAGCVNTATLDSRVLSAADGVTHVRRTVRMCSSYSCSAWHAAASFDVRYGRPGGRLEQGGPRGEGGLRDEGGGRTDYGGLAYAMLRSWTSHTGDGTAEQTEAADFYVIINGIPITVEWHVRATGRPDGSWHVVIYHT